MNATCYDPDAPPQTVKCSITDGVARMILPKIAIYKIVLVEKTRG